MIKINRYRLAHIVIIAMAGALALTAGCATLPEGDPAAVHDPMEPINRPFFAFNSGLDKYLLRPIAVGYAFVTPDPVETVVRNFFVNLRSPVDIGNALLQGKFEAAGSNTGRAIVNSTVGIGGLFDVARWIGLERQPEDFGQTLAVWGISSGPFLVLPFVGPLTPRAAIGGFADSYAAPLLDKGLTISEADVRDKLLILGGISQRAGFLDKDQTSREAEDAYALFRAAYLRQRQAAIHDASPQQKSQSQTE